MNSPSLTDLRAAKKEVWERLFRRVVRAHGTVGRRPPVSQCSDNLLNIVGVAIGYKRSDGRDIPDLCVRVLVRKKIPRRQVRRSATVLRNYGGIETDVEEVGNIRSSPAACAIPTAVQPRPFVCGVSIGSAEVSAGSLAYLVRRKNTNRYFALTNYHVLFKYGEAFSARDAYQPGRTDFTPGPNTLIGQAVAGQPVRLCTPSNQPANSMDAALIELAPGTASRAICAMGSLRSGKAVMRLGTPVWMFGRTSKGTWGMVRQIDVDALIPVGNTCALFKSQAQIGPTGPNNRFGRGGDSGSMVVTQNKFACGLFFAVDGRGGGYATPISRVLRRFDVVID